MVLALDADAVAVFLAINLEQVAVEYLVHLAQSHAILRALGSGEAGDDRTHVEFERVGEDRIGGVILAPHALRLAIGFDQSDRFRVTTGQAHVIQRLVVDGEEAAGRAIFGRHVGDGRAIGEAHRRKAGAVKFDETADDALGAQHLRHGQHQIGRGDAFLQLAGQFEADDLGNQHRYRLAQHRGFRLDPADAPAEHAQPVDHRRVAVGADQRVGIGDGRAIGRDRIPHRVADIFQVHLMTDAGARRHDLEIVERLRSPFQEFVALAVALIFQLDVILERLGRAEFVDHHRVVDDEVNRHLRIDLGRVAAQLGDRVAHRRQIDDAGHAGEILHQHARGAILDFAVRTRVLLPVDQSLRVVGRDGRAVFEAQHILQQHLHRKGQARDVAQFRCGLGQRIEAVLLAANIERVASAERVLADGCHERLSPSLFRRGAHGEAAGSRASAP